MILWSGRLLDRRARQHGFAGLHDVDVVKRPPGRGHIGLGRMRLVVPDEVADQRLGDPKLHVGVDMGVVRVVTCEIRTLKPGLTISACRWAGR